MKAYRDRLGVIRYYFRRKGFKSAALRGEPGSPEFVASYEAASRVPVIGAKRRRPGTIYFVQIRGFDLVKIGYGTNPDRRLRQIEHGAGMPGGLVTLHRMSGYLATERALHRRFSEQRLFGEWFRLSGPIEDWLRSQAAVLAA